MSTAPALDASFCDRSDHRDHAHWWSDRSADGMVATAHYEATRIGAEVLGRGGNAVDAAVAASLALGVCEPAGSGLGGMAIFLIHLRASGRTFVVEGPCRAPSLATPEAVAGSHRYRGHRAVAVPTHPATLAWVLERYGTRPASELLEPAAELAAAGLAVTPLLASLTSQYESGLAAESGARLYLPQGRPLRAGEHLRNPELAATLRRLAEHGLADFYTGEIGRRIARDMRRNEGFVSEEDLREVPWPAERDPLVVRFRGWDVASTPPPSGGITLLEMMRILEGTRGGEVDPEDPSDAVLLAEVIRRARRDRQRQYRRTRRAPDTRIEELIEEPFLARAVHKVRARLDEPGETTHLSVADRDGNVVALTQSIERSFGSKVAAEGLGFLYNGYLRAFKVQAKNHPHYLRPGADARSNAAPTLAFRKGEPVAAIGCSGSERMASSIFLTLLRLARGADPFDAVHAPRMHATPDDLVLFEERFAPEVLRALEARGFTLRPLEPYAFKTGGLQLVARVGGDHVGVGEPRRDGAASRPRPGERGAAGTGR